MDKITIRPAFKEDAPFIAALSLELGYNVTVQQTIDNLAAIEKSIYDTVLVAVVGGVIAGWIQVGYSVHLESGCFCEITGLIISEAHRGKGTGRRLIDSAVKWSRNRACYTVKVRSNVFRKEAHLFYERNGFMPVKEQKVFELRVD